MHLFYTPDIDSNAHEYVLSEEESKHCVRVLRLGKGDAIVLIDGKGNLFHAELIDDHPKRSKVGILSIERNYGKRNHYLHIAVAPTKNIDRLEWFLEKATEIGIDEITPIICERSERKEVKIERLNKVVTAAVKQSLTAYHPKVNEPVAFQQFVEECSVSQKFIAHCLEAAKTTLTQAIDGSGSYCILIGPEGDFSQQEVESATNNGYQAISLGNTRLRTETAALYACMEVNLAYRTDVK
ncbi:16S rRNA (uracil(1498)-N(3))-methyltransferase [Olivibacter sp. XZL3]|uniref:16S rRNA (uracil(1498)-N(3))-methyltransferase n=1 Tax=Olivibacter sp. XZL3 TaxID=1735116 RepID=UPI001064FDD5|nr:16S rRNA (uracil(1498)-N(3))-methyltransferase [Olivibacter sp. XZL3]